MDDWKTKKGCELWVNLMLMDKKYLSINNTREQLDFVLMDLINK